MALGVTATATATAVTATVTGAAAGAVVAVQIATPAGVTEDAGTRTGNGTVTLAPLDSGRKIVTAWLTSGGEATATEVVVPSTDAPEVAWYRVVRLDRVPGSPYMRARVEREERPVEPQ